MRATLWLLILFGIAVAGALWGIPGGLTMVVHDRNRKRRRAAADPTASDSFKTRDSGGA